MDKVIKGEKDENNPPLREHSLFIIHLLSCTQSPLISGGNSLSQKGRAFLPEKVLVHLFVGIDALHHSQQFFGHVWTFPGFNQYSSLVE